MAIFEILFTLFYTFCSRSEVSALIFIFKLSVCLIWCTYKNKATYGHILLKNGNLKDSFHTILHFWSFCYKEKYFFLVCLFRLGFGQFDQSELPGEGFVWTHTIVKWQSFFLHFSHYFCTFCTNIFFLFIYHTRTIITRGLYNFYPIFEVHKHFFKGLFS